MSDDRDEETPNDAPEGGAADDARDEELSEEAETEETADDDGGDTDDIVRSIGKSGIVVFAGTFLELGIAFFAKLIVAQDLSQASYGEVTVGLTILTVTAILGRLGFDTGIPRNAPRYEGEAQRGVFVSSLLLNVLVSALMGVVLFASAGFVADLLGNPNLADVLRVVALGTPAIPLMRVSLSGTQAVGRSSPKVIVQNFTHPITRIVLIILVVLAGARPVTVAAAYVASNWIGALGAVYFLVRYTPILDRSIGWEPKYREMLTFSLPLMVTTGLSFILGNTDTLMIQYFQGSADVGVYDIGYTIAQMLSVGLGSLSYLFLPSISDLHSEGKWTEITHIYRLVTKWIVFVTIPPYLLVTYFPTTVISNTFGSKYAGGAIYLVILASSYMVTAGSGPNKRTLSAIGDTTYIMYVNVFAATVNVVLNAVLILTIGTVGAAIASAVALVSVHVLYSARLYRTYDIWPYSWSLVRPVGAFLAVTGAIYLVVRYTIGRPSLPVVVALVGAAAVLYGVTILALGGLEEDDVMLVRSAEQSLGIDLEPLKRQARRLL
ncbi:MAG: flippase [Halosimplex sp.]